MHSFACRALFSSALCLALVTGCKKTSDEGGTASPGDGSGTPEAGGVLLAYKNQPFKLREQLEMTMEISGPGAGSLTMALAGSVAVSPHASGQLRVDSVIEQVDRYELGGALKPTVAQGEPEVDLAKILTGTRSHAIINMRGEDDDAATEALPENVKKQQELEEQRKAAADSGKPSPELMARELALGAVLSLPQLPTEPLEEGQTLKVPTKEEERPLGPTKLPIEVDRTYTSKNVDSSSGQRLITVEFYIEGSGAKEMAGPAGNVMMSYNEETEGTLVFNLDEQIPVSIKVVQATSMSAGEMNFEQSLNLAANFDKL